MAEYPELWTEKTPEKRHLYDVVPTFGAAHDAELMRNGHPPAPRPPRPPRRERGPFITYLRLPWSYGDRSPGDFWRRVQCRRGRHVMGGGHTMQLGSSMVYVERTCRWCGAAG